jgi:hypothetical protein
MLVGNLSYDHMALIVPSHAWGNRRRKDNSKDQTKRLHKNV